MPRLQPYIIPELISLRAGLHQLAGHRFDCYNSKTAILLKRVFCACGQVAQLVERSPEKAGVGGSTPSLATIFCNHLASSSVRFWIQLGPIPYCTIVDRLLSFRQSVVATLEPRPLALLVNGHSSRLARCQMVAATLHKAHEPSRQLADPLRLAEAYRFGQD